MQSILFAWVGMADLKACEGAAGAGLGPIGQAVAGGEYERAVLLSDHGRGRTAEYKTWLERQGEAKVTPIEVKLSSPTAFGEIYEHAVTALSRERIKSPDFEFTFHISPGTPAMAAVWVILAKTRFPATLIESSTQKGVRVASVPFDISADYLPDLLRKPDEDLVRLTQGLPPKAPEFDAIIHRCTAMQRLIAKARKVALRNIPVLILGESGTGKELLARAIHQSSPRNTGPFVPVNCGAIPKELVESELFGHEKGAFTGASSARKGYLEAAHGGTLFLDELGELPPPAQVKLLRALQEGEVVPVGGTKSRKVSFRVIAATNVNLMEAVARGGFREDLFHRVAVAILSVPPLRERREDIGLLIDSLLHRIQAESKAQPGFEHKKLSVKAKNLLASQPWPGNVRELHNTLQRAALWSGGAIIDGDDIQEALLPAASKIGVDIMGRPLGEGFNLPLLMDEVARHYLQRAMDETHGNKTQAAELIGLPSYQTLTNWLKKYRLDS